MENKISFWLIPSREDLAYFQEIINTFAKAYDAPTFTPHVTIFSGEYESETSLECIVEQATQGIKSLSLRVEQVLYTEEFTKSLFVQFQQNSTLSQICETLRSYAKIPSKFTLNPHLSLIYQNLNEDSKKKLITQISLPKSEVLFNEVRVISTPNQVATREDVEMWKLLLTKSLPN